jgi:hypothetical protein
MPLLTTQSAKGYGFGTLVSSPTFGYDSIASVTPTGSDVNFTSIPSTYTHLQIRATTRGSSADYYDLMTLVINGDTGTNKYFNHAIRCSPNGTVTAVGDYNLSAAWFGWNADGATATYTSGGLIATFPDYANTNKNKSYITISGYDNNGTGGSPDYRKGTVDYRTGTYRSTSAISSIKIQNSSVSNWATGTTFSLYGIKG